jgi:hypothetical protein
MAPVGMPRTIGVPKRTTRMQPNSDAALVLVELDAFEIALGGMSQQL